MLAGGLAPSPLFGHHPRSFFPIIITAWPPRPRRGGDASDPCSDPGFQPPSPDRAPVSFPDRARPEPGVHDRGLDSWFLDRSGPRRGLIAGGGWRRRLCCHVPSFAPRAWKTWFIWNILRVVSCDASS